MPDHQNSLATHPLETLGFAPDPTDPGWWHRDAGNLGSFSDSFGVQRVRIESPNTARLRIFPRLEHCNMRGILHGGFVLAVIDHALFMGPAALDIPGTIGGRTIGLCSDFLMPLQAEKPVDFIVEVMRDTYRVIFLRGIVEQDGRDCVSFSGKTRKSPS